MFCRFLRLLSEYDWSFSPLIVDVNGDLTPKDDKEINVCAAKVYFVFSLTTPVTILNSELMTFCYLFFVGELHIK